MIGEPQLLREMRRVFRAMDEGGARLIRLDAERFVLTRGRGRTRAMAVAAEAVAEFLRRGWLAADGEALALSDAGQGVLRRLEAREAPFLHQHSILQTRRIVDPDGVERFVTVNEGESPLGWLHSRGTIDDIQLAAGEKLRRDYTLAGLTPRLAVDLEAPALAGPRGLKAGAPLPETVVAAKQRFSRALDAAGPGLADLVFDVCCHLVGLEQCERAKRWPRRSAKIVLCIALDRLAVHYGLRNAEPVFSRMRTWRGEG